MAKLKGKQTDAFVALVCKGIDYGQISIAERDYIKLRDWVEANIDPDIQEPCKEK